MSRWLLAVLVGLALVLLTSDRVAVANGILIAERPGATPPTPTSRAARNSPVRLTAHNVRARVIDRVADVTVEQVFHNDLAGQLEGTYLFPLPEGAVVNRFAMTMGGKMVEGEIMDADKARRIYHGIVRRRRDPGLLEYMGRGLFRARVFPIPGHGDVRIRIGFQQVLPEDAGVIEFRYPLASDRFSATPVENTSVVLDVTSQVDIKGVYSPSHDFEIRRTGERKAHASLESKARRQTRDALLYIARSPEAVGFSILSNKRAGEDGTFMAVLAPRNALSESERVPKDVIYVLDTSGSMAGQKLAQATAALKYGVKTLRPGDRFNILAFSSAVRSFRDGLVQFQQGTRKAALRWVSGLEARGGTNIEQALRDALLMPQPDRLTLVVFITDGKPTVGIRSPDAIVRRARELNDGRARVFTFGVGYDLDVALLDRIAEASRGARDYVAPGEDIEIVTGRFFRKVDRPAMTDVQVEYGAGVYDVYPKELPDLFAGGQVVIYGRYKEGGVRVLELRGKLAGRAVEEEYGARFSREESADFLPRLWAHRKIAFLLDDIRLHGTNEEVVKEIVHLATRHAIVTPYTAGLVVEESELGPRIASENPLFQIGGRRLPGGGVRGSGTRYQGPAGGVPPGQREPSDPTPPPPAPPSGPPSTPTPSTPMPAPPMPAPATPAAPRPNASPGQARAEASKDLQKRKKAARQAASDDRPGAIKNIAGKTFGLRKDGRWVDTTWDRKKETVKVEIFSEAYFALLEKDERVAKYFAVGPRVVFVLDDVVYEVVPEPKPEK